MKRTILLLTLVFTLTMAASSFAGEVRTGRGIPYMDPSKCLGELTAPSSGQLNTLDVTVTWMSVVATIVYWDRTFVVFTDDKWMYSTSQEAAVAALATRAMATDRQLGILKDGDKFIGIVIEQ